MKTKIECLEFMETEDFKAIQILESLRDCSNVRFLDETLDEAIEELKLLIKDYKELSKCIF